MNRLSEFAAEMVTITRGPMPAPAGGDLPSLSEAQLAVLAKLVERHPGCHVEVQNCGGGFYIVRAKDRDTGKLVFASHIFPPWRRRL